MTSARLGAPVRVGVGKYVKWSISPNFFVKRKDTRGQCLGKNSPFNFTNILVKKPNESFDEIDPRLDEKVSTLFPLSTLFLSN